MPDSDCNSPLRLKLFLRHEDVHLESLKEITPPLLDKSLVP
ncbi:hypothetical protein LEP1GSC124_1502 [Leptospira interrogans serovar Pyrogenes str. 200701872]|uniref:Uncharacterized protein n=1 Tax=Leptospira interrogans serovar Pyrogenes str. 200701872 TaxID=1193029 RepID=M6ZUB6_LEPIR|nr:hypothetical protein LEP1GSC124_1502 [Leptospira interrogans serovar Pyrogenes str. 200701872]